MPLLLTAWPLFTWTVTDIAWPSELGAAFFVKELDLPPVGGMTVLGRAGSEAGRGRPLASRMLVVRGTILGDAGTDKRPVSLPEGVVRVDANLNPRSWSADALVTTGFTGSACVKLDGEGRGDVLRDEGAGDVAGGIFKDKDGCGLTLL